jgi:L-2,4-diaminobutyrate decarboxylase
MTQDLLQQAFDPSSFREEAHRLVDLLADYLESVQQEGSDLAVMPSNEPDALHQEYRLDNIQTKDLFSKVLNDSIHVHHPKYVGHQVCPPIPMTALAGLFSDLLNNGMGVYEMGQAANAIEREVVRNVAHQMNLGAEAGGFLTSGGTLGNLTALLTARSLKADTPVWSEGHTEKLALMVSEQAHYCVDRAVKILGWGEDGIVKVPVDSEYRMRTDLLPELFSRAKQQDIQVIAVVGSACSTATGSFDDLRAIGEFCRKENLWFHVDGAHGGALVYSQKYCSRVQGLELADSVVMDFHKMLLTQALTTALIYRNHRHAYATFQQKAEYLWSQQEAPEWFNPAKRTFECTKVMMGLRPYLLLHRYGPAIFDAYTTRVMDLTLAFAEQVKRESDFELAIDPQCNILCFRFRKEGLAPEVLNELNSAIRQEIIESGKFYLVQTRLQENLWLRCTFTHPFTTWAHFNELLEEIRSRSIKWLAQTEILDQMM